MNDKKVKKMRRLAREKTVGWPVRRYVRHEATGVIRLHPQCTRSVYQEMKRNP